MQVKLLDANFISVWDDKEEKFLFHVQRMLGQEVEFKQKEKIENGENQENKENSENRKQEIFDQNNSISSHSSCSISEKADIKKEKL